VTGGGDVEALLTGLAQYGPGAIMAGAVCLFTWRILTVTIPEREKDHRAEMAARDAAHAVALEAVRRFYAEWLEAERSMFRDALAKLEKNGVTLEELRDAVNACTAVKRRESP